MLINNKAELKRVLFEEKILYLDFDKLSLLKLQFTREYRYMIWKYMKYLRICEYHLNNIKHGKWSIVHSILLLYYRRRKNKIGMEIGCEIHENCVGKGFLIYHGGIVINSQSRIGDNCKFHGDNCVGNLGRNNLKPPILGSNVELGIGAKVIGNIFIADDCKVGANAVVTKTVNRKGTVLLGVPAKEK